MKTAISVPDETFARVESTTHSLGMTRSEFYARAAQHYLAYLEEHSLTSEINAALVVIDGIDDSSTIAIDAGRRRLDGIDDEW